MTISKQGIPITSLREWYVKAPPKNENQWKPGRSALELANAWLATGPSLPDEVLQAFQKNPMFGTIASWHAEPEVRLPFDQSGREPRNSDLVVEAHDEYGAFLIAVEAKADEPFGENSAQKLADALDRLLTKPRSKEFRRMEQLCTAILGPRMQRDVPLKDIRYQLLTATAGTICEAARRGIDRAVFLVQEFVTDQTRDSKHLANQMDLDLFVRRISHGTYASVPCGEIIGPMALPGAPLFSNSMRFFIGKVSRNIRGS